MRRLLLVLLGATVAGSSIYAHHSFAADYDESQIVSIEGELLRFEYKNPHSVMYIAVKDEQGQVQTFGAEWRGLNRLKGDGVTATTFKPGDYLILSGSPGRRAADRRLHLKGIQRPADGGRWGR
jgi:hypothetical protein